MLLPALFISCFTVFFALRVAVSYSRAVDVLKRLKVDEVAQLPMQIRQALRSRWVKSWQSPVFYEIAIGDISWAPTLSLGPAVEAMRRDFRWMIVGFAGVFVALSIQLLLSR